MDDWIKFASDHPEALPYVACSAGTGEADFQMLSEVLNKLPQIWFICLDVANGYSEHFVSFVARVREAFPKHTIMVLVSECFQRQHATF